RRHTRSKRDWSSDVCSSDLQGLPRLGDDPTAPGIPLLGGQEQIRQIRPIRFPAQTVVARKHAQQVRSTDEGLQATPVPATTHLKIGRASCRERDEVSEAEVT